MPTPIVSICIPTYCGDKYLRECLDSVISQTFLDFEILIVDDGSTDSTVSIVREYMCHDSRIKLFCNKRNLGLVSNWNRCIELAQGEWIKFVFQDDTITPDCIDKMFASVTAEAKIIFCRRNFIFDNTINELKRQWFLNHSQMVDDLFGSLVNVSAKAYSEIILHEEISLNLLGEPTVVMLHRSIFSDFGLFNSNLIQLCDSEFWTRLITHTGVTYVPEILATFRVHSEATTSKNENLQKYRANTLDVIVILHDFAFHPMYTNLRTVGLQQSPPIDLTLRFKEYANSTWLQAKEDSNPVLLEEWNKISEMYPIMRLMAKRSRAEKILKAIKTKLIVLKQFLRSFKMYIFKFIRSDK